MTTSKSKATSASDNSPNAPKISSKRLPSNLLIKQRLSEHSAINSKASKSNALKPEYKHSNPNSENEPKNALLDSSTLTKAQLSELISSQVGLNRSESKDIVDAFFNLLLDCLAHGEDLKITGFGHFQIREKAPRPGRNPRTGEAVDIKARRVVTFHASQKLKDQVHQGIRTQALSA